MLRASSRWWPGLAARARWSSSWLVALTAALAAVPAAAQLIPATQITGYLTVGTDARSRGLSQIYDDSTAAEIGVGLDFPSGVFAGAALSNVSYVTGARWPEPREHLIKLYAGYRWRIANWQFGGSLGHYRYPDTTFDYDYSELTAAVSYRDRFFYDVSVTNDFMSLSRTALDHAIGFTWPLAGNVELSAALGKFESRGRAPSYTHYNAGFTKVLGAFSVDLRYYDTSREISTFSGTSGADNWVLSASYAMSLRD